MATQRAITHSAIQDPQKKQQIIDRALRAYEKHGTIGKASEIAKIDRRTLKGWIKADPMLQIAFREADEAVTDDLEESAIAQAKAGNGRVMVHMLSCRRERYRHKTIVEVQNPSLEEVVEKMRQIATAQPTLAPMVKQALQLALEKLG